MVWSRHLGTTQIDHIDPPQTTVFAPPAGRLWVVRHIGIQVPAGGVLAFAGPGWTVAPAMEGDNSAGTRPKGFALETFIVIEAGQSAGVGWSVTPPAGSGFVQIDGYDLPFP